MRLITMGKLTLGLLLAGALAGCLDVKVDVALTSTTTAEATVTQTMGADFYAMVKLNAEEVASKKAAADDKPVAGEAKPDPKGEIQGSEVYAYVWPTSIDSAAIGTKTAVAMLGSTAKRPLSCAALAR